MRLQSFLDGFLCGIIIGTLFAPASGEETRKRLAKRFSDFRDSLSNVYQDSKEEVSKSMSELKEEEEQEIKDIYNEIKNDRVT